MNLQEVYVDYYGKWLKDGGMDYIDFDGLESCIYQGHGQYSFKRFYGKLFESYQKNVGKFHCVFIPQRAGRQTELKSPCRTENSF